jgi:hypothetical protein
MPPNVAPWRLRARTACVVRNKSSGRTVLPAFAGSARDIANSAAAPILVAAATAVLAALALIGFRLIQHRSQAAR